ncbi:MAG: polysaccharide deacetylase family protein [Bacillota bacterium]
MKKISLFSAVILLGLFVSLLPALPAGAEQVYRVQEGDTLEYIAGRNNISMDKLLSFNSFIESPYILFPGQAIIIPDSKPGVKYTVGEGETLNTIAGEHGIDVETLASYNDLGNINVFTGQVIIIPPLPKGEIQEKKKPETNIKSAESEYSISRLMKEFPGLITSRGPRDRKIVALTFDDGPDEKYTQKVMAILEDNDIKGTFFLIGSLVEKYPAVVEELVKGGHQVAGHGWSHKNLRYLERPEIRSELIDTSSAISEITGFEPVMFRPPYGALSADVMREVADLGYLSVGWTADSLDWYSRSADRILASTLVDTKRGSIILMHSAGVDLDETLRALPELIFTLKAQGYTFVTVAELLGKEPYKKP